MNEEIETSKDVLKDYSLLKKIDRFFYFSIKRLFDIVFSLLGIMFLLPISLIVKISYVLFGDYKTIFYKQKRIGKNGKIIYIFKYRTMIPDADKVLKELLKKQHSNFLSNRNYNINSVLHFDRNILKQYFKELPEMKAENMIIPQNARIVWNGKNFNIEPEKLGRQIDIEKSVDFAIAQLSNGGGEVYFTIITAHKPEVTTEDLASRKDYLNTILKSYLRFKLSDGNVVILNQNTIKTWIKEDEKYGYIVDVENGTDEFIKMLAEKVESANKRSHLNQKLDEQAEKEAIYEALEQTGTVDVEMFYIK